MNEHLRERILRNIEALPDERGYQILDYVEFLESKYAERSAPSNVFTRITDRAEDILRAGKVPINAISGTVGFFDGASKVMKGLASAAQAVVDEASRTAQSMTTPKPVDPAASAATETQHNPSAPPPPSGQSS